MSNWVADYSVSRPSGTVLKAAGCVGVVRYAGALTPSFNISKAEAADLAAHGLPVAIVCEQRDNDILGGRDVGAQMARAALADTRAAGLPDGLVYAACDLDATKGGPTSPGSPGDLQMAQVHQTLLGFADVLGWANVGFYGSYFAIDWLIAKAVPVAAYWCTEAWSNGQHHPRAALYQRNSVSTLAGVDYNDVLGHWHPRTATPTTGGHVPTFTGVHPERLHPAFADQLHQLAAISGHDIHAQSTGRTDAEQQYLYNGWLHRLPGFNPANPPGGPSWHRYIPGVMHAQAADISTVGLGGATARSVFGPHVAKVGLEFAIASESWHIQPAGWKKHPEVPFGTVTPPEDDMAIPLPRLDLAREVGHPASVDLFCDLVRRLNPSADVSTPAARAQTCKNMQSFFKISGGADGVCGPNTWSALLYLATKGAK